MRAHLVILALALCACGPAPGYAPDGRFVGNGEPHQAQQAPAYDPSQGQSPPAQREQGAASSAFYEDLSAARGAGGEAPPVEGVCDDSCRFASNGECDDGRSGSDTDLCAPGTDCSDCGR